MSFDFNLLYDYAPLLLEGLWNTVWIVCVATMISLTLGLALAVMLTSKRWAVRAPVRAYIEIMRGTPVLIILFVLYYGGPSIGLLLDAIPAGIVGLGFYGAAYFAEIFRGGLQSIPLGQVEAARMMGMSSLQILRRIKAPQMLGLILPPMANQMIILIKESALLSIITVPDLTKNTGQMVSETFAVVEPYVAVAILYWLIIEAVARLFKYLEARAKYV